VVDGPKIKERIKMMTTRQLIERLEQIEHKLGCPVYVAVSIGDDLPDISTLHVVTDNGQTGDKIVVIIPSITLSKI
jgi:hypothetical protein